MKNACMQCMIKRTFILSRLCGFKVNYYSMLHGIEGKPLDEPDMIWELHAWQVRSTGLNIQAMQPWLNL